MRRYVPRVLLTAALAVSAAACAAGTAGTSATEGGSSGGRYRVLIPTLAADAGASSRDAGRVADELRKLVSNMATHTAIPEREMNRAMSQYKLEQLDEITSRQLAQQIRAENVLWGTVASTGAGLEADVKFIDVRSGDEIVIEDVQGASPAELAQAVFGAVEQKIEGIRQAAFCNDYLSSQQFDRALETCERALAIVPRSTQALYGRATALLNLERNEDALQTYQTLLEIDPAHQDALLGAGLAASRMERSDLAMGFYSRYMEINPGNVDVRMTVANDIAKTGDYRSAFAMLEPVVAENAENLDFQKYFFSIATAAGQKVQEQEGEAAARPYFEAAMRAYQTAFAAPDAELDVSTMRQAIAVNLALGQQQEALRLAQEATVKFDTVAAVWSQYATVLSEAGQHAEAVRALTRVAEIDAEYPDVYIRRALANMEAGSRQQALADLERAANRGNRENVAKVIFKMGADALNAGRFAEASNLLSTANQYATGDLRGQINFFLGFSYYRQGEAIAKANTQGRVAEAQRALEFFRRALPLVTGAPHASAGQVESATKQYIENQEAIIRAGSRGR